MNKSLLPTVLQYRQFLDAAVKKFGISIGEARTKYGNFTIQEWEDLLTK